MNILDFIQSHPLISISGIEKALNITHGTLRRDKIPEKYIGPITDLLSSYGLNKPIETNNNDVTREILDTVNRKLGISSEVARITTGEYEDTVYTFDGDKLPFFIEDGLKKRMKLIPQSQFVIKIIKQ